jgi:intracellular sulfur oxidation DsrE/DsrF family protein
MMNKYIKILIPLLVIVSMISSFELYADNDFAEKHVVLQISDASQQTLVLNVANNLINHYGPDKIAVEIVAFGPGLKLLFENNEISSPRINGLAANGITFSACANTIAAIERKSGKKPKIHKEAGVVPAGVVRIMELIDQGYTLIKP